MGLLRLAVSAPEVIDFALRIFTAFAVGLLQQATKLLGIAVDLGDVVIGQVAHVCLMAPLI
ncbi:hypothetical protein [Advenella kashmirensis]|uniref:hypothetical protein n=1 Tax=Advenella kashmirensis TaxID=310575 RepID=UPI00149406A3|nr:hypothetical protein [Advenella kashmirensis]